MNLRRLVIPCVLVALPLCTPIEAVERKSLRECLTIALEQHPALKSAGAVVDAAQQRVWQAASGYFPHVDASYRIDRRHTSTGAQAGTIDSQPSQSFTFYDTGLTFRQMLLDFGRTLDSIRSAQALQRALQADAITRRAIVVLNVKQSYFQLLAATRLHAVADETLRQNRAHLELAEGRFRVGLAPKFDVTQAQVQLANAELNQITASNNVSLARETLRHAMGVSAPIEFEIVDSLDVHTFTVAESAALDAAYTGRPELQSIYERQQALIRDISALRKDHLPNIVGSGNYDWSGSDYPLQNSWSFGAAISIPILSGGLTQAQIGEAEANLAQVRFDEQTLRQDVALEVRQATLDLHRAERAITVAAKGLQQARENLELAEGRYKTGVGSFIEVTDAQASRSSAEASWVQSLYSYKTAVAALERATAKDWVDE